MNVLSVIKNRRSSTWTIVIQLDKSENYSVPDVTQWLATLNTENILSKKLKPTSVKLPLPELTTDPNRYDVT